ncbi:sel1 repeat family protein [Neptunomonas sp.]|uniref:tetratricopeptide repeat protein n=1 Tax=Neptunomonas sp. TaxID=1971898 RepID=UPI0025CE2DE3|nr:sel1 repeat family protein [Neptunomonas sp.]
MNALIKFIAPGLFSVAFFLFRSSFLKKSQRKHRWVMRAFRFSADNDSRKALSVYGHLLHFRGEDIQNRIQGAIYIQRAADKGDMKSQYQMGKIYESGYENYFPVSDEKSLHYYRLAGLNGHTLAVSRMVKVYQEGELGLKCDLAETKRWQSLQPTL